jgi:hypothetical protein
MITRSEYLNNPVRYPGQDGVSTILTGRCDGVIRNHRHSQSEGSGCHKDADAARTKNSLSHATPESGDYCDPSL